MCQIFVVFPYEGGFSGQQSWVGALLGIRLLRSTSLNRIASFDPAGKAFVENSRVAVSFVVQEAIGQTGQVMGASSIEHHESVFRDLR